MSENNLSELLEKYDAGLTNVDEEERLYKFMAEHPDHRRAPWFIGVRELRNQNSELTISELNQETLENRLWYQRQFIRIAATVLLVSLVGLVALFNKDTTWEILSSKEVPQEFSLPDGSIVTLNRNTIVRYESDFQNSRTLWLDQGEVFFEVVKNAQKPFVVHTTETTTEVTGTSFNISTTTETTEVAVLSGTVTFTDSRTGSNTVKLTPGRMAGYDVVSNHMTRDTIYNINRIAWKTHRLEFNDAPLDAVIRTLEDYFHIDIQTPSSSLLSCRFKGTFDNANLDEISEVMNYTLDVTLTRKEQVYTLSGRGCKP
jgi:transmembrane sensor